MLSWSTKCCRNRPHLSLRLMITVAYKHTTNSESKELTHSRYIGFSSCVQNLRHSSARARPSARSSASSCRCRSHRSTTKRVRVLCVKRNQSILPSIVRQFDMYAKCVYQRDLRFEVDGAVDVDEQRLCGIVAKRCILHLCAARSLLSQTNIMALQNGIFGVLRDVLESRESTADRRRESRIAPALPSETATHDRSVR
jgi:hypothetical protein